MNFGPNVTFIEVKLDQGQEFKEQFLKMIWNIESETVSFFILTKAGDDLIPKQFRLYPTEVMYIFLFFFYWKSISI